MEGNINFYNSSDYTTVAKFIADKINGHINNGERVLWLVPGGSAIKVAVKATELISEKHPDKLSISLTDERYGELGHKDSNWQQLEDSGFSLNGAKLHPVIKDKDFQTTSDSYDRYIERELKRSDYKIALFGMGADGHIAGILPNSEAHNAQSYVASYETPQYKRITITKKAILELDEAVVFAIGKPKWRALDELEKNMPINYQPAQILKEIPSVYVFNDYKGEKI